MTGSVDTGTDVVVAIRTAADRLAAAEAHRVPCAPVRDVLPEGDLAAAYAVQSALVAARTGAGARRVGRKIGLTNPRVQAQLGVDEPDFGVLLDDMQVVPGRPVDVTRLLQPRIEAEVAFVLAVDLDQALVTEADVVDATDHVVAALEIVDSRIADWDITIVDTVADNGSSGLFALGIAEMSLDGLDLADVRMTMRSGDHVVSTGTGADCLGSPLRAVAWLANTARDHGAPLQAGDIVLSGALGPMVPVGPGSSFTAHITGLGTVTASFGSAGENT